MASCFRPVRFGLLITAVFFFLAASVIFDGFSNAIFSLRYTHTLGLYRYECTTLSTAIKAAQSIRRMHEVCESSIASLQAFARHTLMLRLPSFIDSFTTSQMLLESHIRYKSIVIVCFYSLYASFLIQTSFHPSTPRRVRSKRLETLRDQCRVCIGVVFLMSPALNSLSLAAANWLPTWGND